MLRVGARFRQHISCSGYVPPRPSLKSLILLYIPAAPSFFLHSPPRALAPSLRPSHSPSPPPKKTPKRCFPPSLPHLRNPAVRSEAKGLFE